MRDIDRIDNFMRVLGDEWKRQSPDLRFGQFLMNNGVHDEDIFNIEETEFLFKFFPNIPKREYITWGTRGKDGKQPVKRLLLKDLETDHIKNILKTQTQLSKVIIVLFKEELKLRRKIVINKLLNK